MTDEEYIFRTDCAEKKRTARGSFSKRTHAGKSGCKTPSEYLTKKEREKMNGKVQSYNLNRPMTWVEFKQMPDDIEREYLENIVKKYSPTQAAVSKMFGISDCTISILARRLGVSFGKNVTFKGRNDAFWAWVNKPETEQEAKVTPAETVQQVTPAETVQQESTGAPESGMLTFTGTTAQAAFNAAYMLLTTATMRRIVISWETENEQTAL